MRIRGSNHKLNGMFMGIIGLVILSIIGCWSSTMPAKVTVPEVKSMIDENIPIGSTRTAVTDFIESLKIDDLKVVHDDYYEGMPPSSDDLPNNINADIAGYLVAAILKVESDRPDATYNIRIVFCFDNSERLLGYAISKRGQVL